MLTRDFEQRGRFVLRLDLWKMIGIPSLDRRCHRVRNVVVRIVIFRRRIEAEARDRMERMPGRADFASDEIADSQAVLADQQSEFAR